MLLPFPVQTPRDQLIFLQLLDQDPRRFLTGSSEEEAGDQVVELALELRYSAAVGHVEAGPGLAGVGRLVLVLTLHTARARCGRPPGVGAARAHCGRPPGVGVGVARARCGRPPG